MFEGTRPSRPELAFPRASHERTWFELLGRCPTARGLMTLRRWFKAGASTARGVNACASAPFRVLQRNADLVGAIGQVCLERQAALFNQVHHPAVGGMKQSIQHLDSVGSRVLKD